MAVVLDCSVAASLCLADEDRRRAEAVLDLLAEREMTAVLQLLQDIARHLDVKTLVTPAQLGDLVKKTDLQHLTDRLEELAEPVGSTDAPTADQRADSRVAATR